MKKKTSFNDLFESIGLGWTIVVVILTIVFAAGLIFGLMCLEAWFVMLLWNSVLNAVVVTVLPITFWQAMGLGILIDLLFGGFGRAINNSINKHNE